MTFKKLNKAIGDRKFPMFYKNDDEETCVIERLEENGKKCIRETYIQKNGKCRQRIFWEDNTLDVLYEK